MKEETPDVCPLTQHKDGTSHGWLFDGDDPYVICYWCGEVRDAISNMVIKSGRNPLPKLTSETL